MATMEKTSLVQVNRLVFSNWRIWKPIVLLFVHQVRPDVLTSVCFKLFCYSGQDGTLQSFSTVHERFNKNLGHGQWSTRICVMSCNSTAAERRQVSLIQVSGLVQDPLTRRRKRTRRRGCPTRSSAFPPSQRSPLVGHDLKLHRSRQKSFQFNIKTLITCLRPPDPQLLLASQTGMGLSPVTVVAR